MKKGIIIAIVSILLIGIISYFIFGSSNTVSGSPATTFSVKSVDGNTLSLDTQKGKPTVVYFFATWCPYCHQDFEALKTIYPDYKNKVDIIAIDLDLKEDESIINNYTSKNGYQWIFAIGNRDVLLNYNVRGTTKKVAISKSGKVVWTGTGPLDADNWKKLLDGTIQSE